MKLLLSTSLAMMLLGARAEAANDAVLVGDPVNGKKLYAGTCAACHGDAGSGGRTGIALTDSGRMNLIRNDQMFGQLEKGEGLKKPKDHTFAKDLRFLDIWDVIAYVRTLHMTLDEFFPQAGRYVSKEYTIDKFGLERIKEAAGLSLQGSDQKGAVFTFFDFDGEAGNLTYVPQDPIRLDHLKKKFKSGYLVFLPFEDGSGFKGEIGVAMDPKGVITKLLVHDELKGADLLNKSLSRFSGMGQKGQREKFKIGGGKPMEHLAEKVFPTYLRAMETVTMYDREEKERTWADEE
jgi:mono/diheme cytochrome c family protein